MLQCVLQCVAVYCSALQGAAVCIAFSQLRVMIRFHVRERVDVTCTCVTHYIDVCW